MTMATPIPHGPGLMCQYNRIKRMQARRRMRQAIKNQCADLMVSLSTWTCAFIPTFTMEKAK